MSNALEELRRTVQGGRILAEWIGQGAVPVQHSIAEARAHVCTHGNKGRPCKENREPNWWGRIKSRIATAIKEQMEIKAQCGISVSQENSLHMCAQCGCALPLKVHVPIEHAKKSVLDISSYPEFCWLRKELGNL